jgi:hypothetical protein
MIAYRTLALATLALVACSSSSSSSNTTGGGDTVKQSGQVIDYSTQAPASGATIAVPGGPTTTSDSKGNYSLQIPKGQPYSYYVAGPIGGNAYVKLWEQEAILSGDTDRGQSNAIPVTLENLLKGFLSGYDATKASFTVGLEKMSTCASTEGATIDLVPAQSAAKIVYFKGATPDPASTSAHDGTLAAAIFYNVDPTTKVAVKISWASSATPCTQVPYPVTDPTTPTVSYTGNLTIEAGDVTSYLRVFLK